MHKPTVAMFRPVIESDTAGGTEVSVSEVTLQVLLWDITPRNEDVVMLSSNSVVGAVMY